MFERAWVAGHGSRRSLRLLLALAHALLSEHGWRLNTELDHRCAEKTLSVWFQQWLQAGENWANTQLVIEATRVNEEKFKAKEK